MPRVKYEDWYPGYQAMIREAISITLPWEQVPAGWNVDRDWHARERDLWLRDEPNRKIQEAERKRAYDRKIAELDALAADYYWLPEEV